MNFAANVLEFNLTCKDWLDEGFTEDTWTEDEPLYYLFFLQYGSDVQHRQILYFDRKLILTDSAVFKVFRICKGCPCCLCVT